MSKSRFDELCDQIASRPGAEERLAAEVGRRNRVLDLERLRSLAGLTQ